MLTLNIPSELEQRLSRCMVNNHRSKEYAMQLALEEFLDDYEDYCKAVNISKQIKNGQELNYTLEKLKKRYDLLDA